DLFAREFAEALQTVGIAALPQRFKAGKLVRCGSDDDFAALLVGDVMLAAEGEHLLEAPNGQLGLAGARFVIKPGVEHPAVVAALVLAEGLLLFQQKQFEAWPRLQESPGRGEPDDAAADNQGVVE